MTDAEVASTLLSPTSGRGDWIPDAFKKVFSRTNKGVDFVSCHVFSKILYWHLPSSRGRKKFYGKEVYLSITDLSEQVGITYEQAKRALKELENEYCFIKRRRAGKRTYLRLNQEHISKSFSLHQGSNPDRILVHQGSNPDRESYTRVLTTTHIHKEGHKEQNRKRKVKIFDEEEKEKILNKINIIENEMSLTLVTEEYFLNTCETVSNMVGSRLQNGDPNILEFLLSATLSIDHYPAFARIVYLVKTLGEKVKELNMTEITYQLKTECITNSEILRYMEKYCPEFDQSALGLDVQKLYDKSLERYQGLYDQLVPLQEELRKLENG